jgi:hypothetical protein
MVQRHKNQNTSRWGELRSTLAEMFPKMNQSASVELIDRYGVLADLLHDYPARPQSLDDSVDGPFPPPTMELHLHTILSTCHVAQPT